MTVTAALGADSCEMRWRDAQSHAVLLLQQCYNTCACASVCSMTSMRLRARLRLPCCHFLHSYTTAVLYSAAALALLYPSCLPSSRRACNERVHWCFPLSLALCSSHHSPHIATPRPLFTPCRSRVVSFCSLGTLCLTQSIRTTACRQQLPTTCTLSVPPNPSCAVLCSRELCNRHS